MKGTRQILLVFSWLVSSSSAIFQPSGVPFKSPVNVAPGLDANVIFSNLTTPRGITFDSSGNLLVVEQGFGVTVFSPTTGGYNRDVVVPDTSFTHGIQVDGRNLYVSTAGSVVLYDYDARSKTVTSLKGKVVIDGVPADGELKTHTLQLEFVNGAVSGILVGSGPLTNIDATARDPSSGRSQVRRFPVVGPTSTTPLSWASGRVVAYGIRNPGGFAFSPASAATQGLYIVENGASIDNVTGLTAAFVNDNPADELNIVNWPSLSSDLLPKFFGFPDCTTLWNPKADPVGVPQYVGDHRGDQFSLHLDPSRDDQWCRGGSNNVPPKLSFQAHSVPLDIKFYLGPQFIPTTLVKGLPRAFIGDPFVSFHGSFNRNPPTGYGVVRVPGAPDTSSSALGYEFIVQARDLASCPGKCIRPVGLAFGRDGRLFVSSDSSGELFVISSSST